MVLRVSEVFTCFILVTGSCASEIAAGEACRQHEEASCMLQLPKRAPEPASVPCTYDSSTMCAGDQCCPRAAETGGMMYPCPTANAGFKGCENNTHAAEPEEPASVPCTYDSNTMCAGDQCCPRAAETGGMTYPCPTANAGFKGCENSTQRVLGIGKDPWFKFLVQLHAAPEEPPRMHKPVKMARLEFFKRGSAMEAAMADVALAAKASVVRTPYSLFGRLATRIASVRVPSNAVLYTCHNFEKLNLENTDKRFRDPAFHHLPNKVEVSEEAREARGLCHSVPAAPDHMQYVLLEMTDRSRVRVMEECHAHGLIAEMCHTAELVVVEPRALREIDVELSKASEEQ